MRIGAIAAAMCGFATFWAAPAAAQFPTKPVEIIVPFAAGGSTDLGSRVIAKALQDKWKVPVRVLNQPGGNTAPAVSELMRSPPDGHRVMTDLMSSSSLLGLVVPNLPYKITDRTFVTLTMQTPMILAVGNDSPFRNAADVAEAAKKDPASISWTSLGGTGVIDMAFRRFFRQIGVDVAKTRPVVSKGGSEAAIQTAGGHVMLGSGSYGSYSSLVPAKKVRVIAVFSPERSRMLPDIPTMAESGFPNTEAVQWTGFSGPPNMAPEAVQAWNAAIQDILKDPEVVAGLARVGIEPLSGDGAKMKKIVEDETALLKDLFSNRPTQ